MASEPAASPASSHLRGSRLLLRSVSKSFESSGATVVAVDNVTLEVEPGEFLVLLGPSGCGKTTILRIIGGLETATSGSVVVDNGADASSTSAGEIAIAFQEPRLFPWFTVADNITLPLRLRGIDRHERRSMAGELCRLVGLTGFEDASPNALSGGMKQRASIARALSIRPHTLLLDEPFGALDAMTRDQMNLELQRIWMESRSTVVLVTHSIIEAVFLASRIVLLSPRPGRIHEIFEVPFDRPRDIDVQTTQDFQAIVRRIRHALNGFAQS